MQSCRIEAGKLAETWLALLPLGSAWTDAIAQEHWTSPPANQADLAQRTPPASYVWVINSRMQSGMSLT
jgi:hypothetical protein